MAQAGIAAFVSWLRDDTGQQQVTANVFGTAPRELTSSISLQQTLDLIRAVVDAVEDELGALGGHLRRTQALREAVLRYSREIAFSAAQVYARAAESRGAWDARLEDLVVDAVLRGEADDSMRSRATALGWGSMGDVTVVAGRTPSGRAASTVEAIRRDARSHGGEAWLQSSAADSSSSSAGSTRRCPSSVRSRRTSVMGRSSSGRPFRICSPPAAPLARR